MIKIFGVLRDHSHFRGVVIAAGISSFIMVRDMVQNQRVENMKQRRQISESARREAEKKLKEAKQE
jgi:hypothetical protein